MAKGGGSNPMDEATRQYADLEKMIGSMKQSDSSRIMDEVNAQRGIGNANAAEYSNERKKALADLSTVLADSQKRQLMDRVPELAEQANLQGIFRSTGMGNAIAQEASKLAAATSDQLAQQGLADREANITDKQNVDSAYLQGRYSPIQRELSLEDYLTQAKSSLMTGAAAQAPSSGGKTSAEKWGQGLGFVGSLAQAGGAAYGKKSSAQGQ